MHSGKTRASQGITMMLLGVLMDFDANDTEIVAAITIEETVEDVAAEKDVIECFCLFLPFVPSNGSV